MNIFGLRLFEGGGKESKALDPITASRGGWYRLFESYAGAWQQNVEVDVDTALTYHAVYSCMTLIANDIAKMRVKLMEQQKGGIWVETTNPAYTPVLRKPNPYQTRIQFFENWMLSRLSWGNTYVLKERDGRGVVTAMRILDPSRCTPMVADNGDVYYQLRTDNLSGLGQDVVVPASEIIHDRQACIYHPLIGVSPIAAAGVAAMQGLNMQQNATNFYGNSAMPGGVLQAPGEISQPTADRLKATWETKFTGDNSGKIAVLGDGLEFKQLTMTARDAQTVEQMKWTGEVVCSAFHVPGYKVQVGSLPTHDNIEAMELAYYQQALQRPIEDIELGLVEGLGLLLPKDNKQYGIEFDIAALLRMDSKSKMEYLGMGIEKSILSPNEARHQLNYGPVSGGEQPLAQQQYYSLEELAKRDSLDVKPAAPEPIPPVPTEDNEDDESMNERAIAALRFKMAEEFYAQA